MELHTTVATLLSIPHFWKIKDTALEERTTKATPKLSFIHTPRNKEHVFEVSVGVYLYPLVVVCLRVFRSRSGESALSPPSMYYSII